MFAQIGGPAEGVSGPQRSARELTRLWLILPTRPPALGWRCYSSSAKMSVEFVKRLPRLSRESTRRGVFVRVLLR